MIIKGKDLSTSIKEALKVRVEVLKNQYGQYLLKVVDELKRKRKEVKR